MKRACVHDNHEEAKSYLDACIGEERPTTSNAKREAFLRGGPECLDFLEMMGMRWTYAEGYSDYHEAEYPHGSVRGRAIVAPLFNLRELGAWGDRIGFNLETIGRASWRERVCQYVESSVVAET